MPNQNEPIKNFSVDVTEAKIYEIPEIKDGVYDAVLTGMNLKTNLPDGKGGSFDMLQWDFSVDGKVINGKTSTIISNLSKAYQWISSLTGKEPSGKFTPSMVEGKSCQIVIKHQKKERKFNNETQTLNMPYVHDVLPTK